MTSSAPSATGGGRSARTCIARVALFALAAAAVTGLVRLVGAHEVAEVLGRCAFVVPLVLVCEGARIALELRATRALYGVLGVRVPLGALVRSHLVGYAMITALPAGRAVAEAYVAAALSRFSTPAKAASVAAVSHTIALAANALVGAVCFLATSALTGMSALTIAIGIHTTMVGLAAIGLTLVSRSRWALSVAERAARSLAPGPRAEALLVSLSATRDACRVHEGLPGAPLALHVVARALQALGIGLLLGAASESRAPATLLRGLAGQAVHLVGSSAGDLVPFQLGATDGGFALAAPSLGLSRADAVGVALLLHAAHLVWTAVGALVPLLRALGRPSDEGRRAA